MPQIRYVVASDLSSPSRVALAQAAALARRTGASIELYCAVPASIVDEERQIVDRVRDGLGRLAKRTSDQGIPCECAVETTRDVPKAIADHAEQAGAELVAVGPSGVTGWKKFVLGSVTERLLRLIPAQLLIARGRSDLPAGPVVVGVDMTPGSTRAFRAALAVAKACGSKLIAVHAIAPPGAALLAAGDVYLPETWTLEAERVAASQRAFGDWVRQFRNSGVEVEARVLEGHAAEIVLGEARAAGAGLVVVGSHGKTAVHEFFVGSVARLVATHAPVSVLVVRARPPRRDGRPGAKRRAAKKTTERRA